MAGRIAYRMICFSMLIAMLMLTSYNCGDPDITNKQYECQKDVDCKRSHSCQGGKCVLADADKDGWAKNKDCNDNNKEVYPGAVEICENLADDNCDGSIDEQPCQCKDGERRDCGSDKGICKKGQQTCRLGIWSKCVGMIEPQEESCDGKDNDCDGHVDENVPNCCQPKETRACGPELGQCKAGIQKCNVGKWTECIGAKGPVQELCNGLDDDCDGRIDNIKDKTEPINQACYSGPPETRKKGLCKDGLQSCKDSQWGLCQKDTLPQGEICDDKDNDCDGQVDNIKGGSKILERACYSADPKTKGKGVCKGGTQRCVAGRWSGCLGEISPIAESCNGIDDDCDGRTDNGTGSVGPLARPCYSGPPDTRQKGLCKDGVQECQKGRWSSCSGGKLPDKEICDNLDNDCDGRVDNNNGKSDALVGTCYKGPAGTQGQGTCKDGKRTCINGQWTSCSGAIWPKKETCDGKDNDCDGQVDENLGKSTSCNTGKSGFCSKGMSQCTNGKYTCKPTNAPQAEICDGKDNNCNGTVDEGNPGGGASCSVSGRKGICAAGKRSCSSGKLTCKQQIFPTQESCNSKDDNCDGRTDENASCPRGKQCGSGQCSTCAQPTSKCNETTALGITFCIKDAPSIQCNCGFTSYCAQQSSSVLCSGCCVLRKCQ